MPAGLLERLILGIFLFTSRYVSQQQSFLRLAVEVLAKAELIKKHLVKDRFRKPMMLLSSGFGKLSEMKK